MSHAALSFLSACLIALASLGISTPAQAVGMQPVHCDIARVVSRLKPVGHLNASQHLRLAISLPLRNQQALTELLAQLQDRSSPNYHKYLTPPQFTERFGPTQQDYDRVIDFAKAHGLMPTGKHPNRLILDVDGKVSDIEKALHITMRTYQHPREARQFFAPDAAPTLDGTVPIVDISGLDNYEPPRPRLKIKSAGAPLRASPRTYPLTDKGANSAANIGSGPGGNYMGNDFRAAYAPGVAMTGSGEVIGLLQFDGFTPADITYYKNLAGLPNVPVSAVLLDGFNGQPSGNGGEVEASLDIEMAISMAPGAAQIIVYEAGTGSSSTWHDILNRMATDDMADQLSCSWYIPSGASDPVADTIFQEMAAQGQSFFSASGDYDAYTGLIPFPSDSPYITQVGGTVLTTNGGGGSYAGEIVWNTGTDFFGDHYGSGGGISTQYAIPTWQQGISMMTNMGSTTMRNVPDVALTAYNVYVRADGLDESVGGTSCAAPLWAGFAALVNQESVANGEATVGFINPAIYTIATGTSYSTAFHDTTLGNNFSPNSPTEFPAKPGYDLCTGLGSPNGSGLIYALAGPPTPYITTSNPLPNAAANAPYAEALTAKGGASPYTWSIASGALPVGLSLSSGGVISGTPGASGTATFSVKVTDAKGAFSMASFGITVYPQGTPVIVTGNPLPTGALGSAYTQTLAASGGAPPYTWSIISGSAPQGLSLSSEGLLSGIPATTGSFEFTVQVTGNDGLFSTTSFLLNVPPPPVITSALVATGTNGAPWSYQITATNRPTSYAASGLPAGFAINAATGTITGTPIVPGTSNVTIGAINVGGTCSATLVIIIAQMPPPLINWPFTTLSSFYFGDGANLQAGLIQGMDGNFYGTSGSGGLYANGTVFKMTPAGSVTTLTSFNNTNGAAPSQGLVQASDGNLYGTTASGGTFGNGTVFKITASGSFTSLYSFNNLDGKYPDGGLTLGSDGNLYGTTASGGSLTYGTVFKITTSGSLTTLYSFDNSVGPAPVARLLQGSDGNFYGSTLGGGTYNAGTIFKITTSGSLTTLHSFDGINGDMCTTQLTQGSDGNLYGTAQGGSNGMGIVFRMTLSGSFATLCPFVGANGATPEGGVIQGADGNFYGTTASGGAGNDGTVFMVTASGSLSVLHSFNVTDGMDSQSRLLQARNGNFYGTTSEGGSYGYGTAFSLSPFSVTAAVGTPFSYQITTTSNTAPAYAAANLPSGLSLNTATGLISGVPTATGTSNVTISATNPGGTTSTTLIITVLAGAPTITSPSSLSWAIGLPFTYQITATQNPTGYGATGMPPGFSVNPVTGVISGNPVTPGTWNTNIYASNAAGTGSEALTISLAIPPPPVITSASSASGTSGIAFNYQIAATNTPTSYSASGLPAGLSVNTATGLISGIATLGGTSNVTVCASNAGGTGSANLTIMMAVPPVPVITSGSNATGFQGQSFNYQIVATSSPTSFGASGLPAGLSVNTATGLISGTLTSSGTTTATICATNIYGTGSATLTLIALGPPVITSPLGVTGTISKSLNYQITAVNSPTSYNATGLPSGLSVNTATGLINGAPTSVGVSSVTMSAINLAGTGSATLTITVILGPPVITSPPTATATNRVAFSYNITATNQPSSYSASGMPPGFSVNTATGLISGTTTASGAGNITIGASNAAGTGTANLYLTIVTPAPVITSASTATATSHEPFSYQITATNFPNSYSATGLPSGLSINTYTGQISGSATSTGTSNVTIGATNPGGTATQNLRLAVVTQPPPSITSPLSINGVFGAPFLYQITATDYPTSYAATGLPAGLTVNIAAGLISGTATMTGTTNATIKAINASGTGSATLTIIVAPGPPVITSAASATGTSGSAFSYQIIGSGSPTSYGASGLPAGLSVNTATGLISGTATTVGTTNGTITASNALGTGTAALSIQILPPLPVIMSGTSSAGTVGFPFRYQITATNNPTGYSATGLPAGLAVDASGGLISGTPINTGSTAASIFASNVTGSGSTTLEIVIGAQPPVITSTAVVSLCSFTGTGGSWPGANPQSGVIQASDGYFYGTTVSGGGSSGGTVYRLGSNGAEWTVMTFTGGNGNTPNAIMQASNGNLYGSTMNGGSSGYGTVYKLTTSGTLTTLVNFNYSNGLWPASGLIQASDGNIYGCSRLYYGYPEVVDAQVFKITPSGSMSILSKLTPAYPGGWEFPNWVCQGKDGNFYGAGSTFGSNGTLFCVTQAGQISDIHDFSGTQGSAANGLTQAADNLFYGTTPRGGANGFGTIFNVTSSGSLTTLCSFTGTSGATPGQSAAGALYQAGDGSLWGTTSAGGGASGAGTIFKATTSGSLTVIYEFTNGSDGGGPMCNLISGSDGNLYGTTNGGGTSGFGTVFKCIGSGIPALTVGGTFNYQITATNGPTSYEATGLPPGILCNPSSGLITGVAGTPGTYNVMISASNAGGAGLGYFTMLVQPGVPVIVSGTAAQAMQGMAFSYQIVANNNPTSYGATGLPAGLSVDGVAGLISGTPSLAGTFNVTLSAGNVSGTGSANLTIDVVQAPPVITSGTSATGIAGLPFIYQITASNVPTSYGACGLTAALILDPVAGLISGTPTTPGVSAFTVSASNSSGTGSAMVTVNVQVSFAGWESEWFTPAQLGDPTCSGDTVTPAGDGIPNLLKYAFNLNPWANGTGGLPVVSIMTIGGTNYLALTYIENIYASDLSYIPEVSGDLKTWNFGAGYVSPVSVTPNADGVTESVIVQDLTPIGNRPRFIRLRITGP
jgi:uncharacterized repeat protein (TIGR03803 family)